LNQKEIYKVEQVVNSMIQANLLVETIECEIEQARDQGATMLFGEKYGERVRMVRMGDVSCELCGGSHVARTGDIGLFHITGQKSVQAGVRRVEAVTGSYAVYEMQQSNELVCKISAFLHASPSLLLNKIKEKAEHEHKLSKQLDTLKTQLATACIGSELQAREVKGVKVLATCARNIQLKGLRNFADHLQSKLGNSVVLVTGVEQNKISGVCTMSKSLSKKLNAQSLLKGVFEITGGHSGGRADFAQGGGGDVAKHGQAFDVFYSLVEKELQSSL
jgi:alanyl-tRNA synthetase